MPGAIWRKHENIDIYTFRGITRSSLGLRRVGKKIGIAKSEVKVRQIRIGVYSKF